MGRHSSKSFPLGLALVLLFHCCAAQLEPITARGQGTQIGSRGTMQQQRHTVGRTQQDQCQIQSLNPLEPTRRIEAEAGFSEIWEVDSAQELQCAGVGAIRHVIQPRGLMLPAFANSPELMYVVQGRGLQGVPFPGCPETYQSPQQSQFQGGRGFQGESERQGDRHQKVRRIREGDVLALPAGALHWFYNDGQSELVLVSILDTASQTNQLDQTVRNFFIAGNPQSGGRRGGQSMFGQGRRGSRAEAHESFANIFSGFDDEILSESFNVESELARRLRAEDDQRGHIVEVQNELQILGPQFEEEESQKGRQGGSRWGRQGGSKWSRRGSRWERPSSRRGGYNGNFTDNGLDETLCTMRLKENINNPVRADVYNPQAGRITTLNSFSLPVLSLLQLSIERGVLHRDAILAPHYHVNCHGIIYVTSGSARIQIVDDSGRNVFDQEVQEGQFLVVPQNFVVVKQAGPQGFNYISFRTNSDGLVNHLAGRLSVLRSLPVEVIMNSYEISREEANSLKNNREEFAVLSPGSRSGRREVQDEAKTN